MSEKDLRSELLNLKSTFNIRAEQYEISGEETTDHNDSREYFAMARAYDEAASEVKHRIEELE